MSNSERSLRPPSPSPARTLRPPSHRHRRAQSTSSEDSCDSADDAGYVSEDQFVFSAGNTPSTEQPPSLQVPASSVSRSAISSTPRDGLLYGMQNGGRPRAIPSITEPLDSLNRSRPIAIERAAPRSSNPISESASIDTPPEPLSARGDIPGGYFPLHEDPKSRVRRPHPFHLDASKAKHRSLHTAYQTSKSTSQVATVSEPPDFPSTASTGAAMSGSHTPVSSYIPNGVHDTAALPLGKYYPSNYERRSNNSSQQRLHPQSRGSLSSTMKSDTQVPKYRYEPSHSRTQSEVKRRLLQYQRDMVAQATVAASALLANNQASPGSSQSVTPTLGGIQLPGNLQIGETLIKTHKPRSPRLAPERSPGPVTPMSLGGGAGDSYLTLGRSITGPDAEHQSAEVAKAIRVEQQRREGGGSPMPISI